MTKKQLQQPHMTRNLQDAAATLIVSNRFAQQNTSILHENKI